MHLTNKLIKKMANVVVYSMNMKQEETVLIRSGFHNIEIAEEIAVLSAKNGVHPTIIPARDEFSKRMYDEVPLEHLRKTSRISMAMIKGVDNYIGLERPKNPLLFEKIPHNTISAVVEGNRPVSDKMDELKIKWAYVGYPTRELAKQVGSDYKTLSRIIIQGMLVKPQTLQQRCNFLYNNLLKAEFVHVYDEFGTDITLKIKGRRVNKDDGYIDDDDIKKGEVGLNLPAGEVFLAPIETYGTGVLFSPKRRDTFTGRLIKNIRLVFEKGKLNLNKCTAEANEKDMKQTILHSIEIDKKQKHPLRTSNVAELGIGINPKIDSITGYLLTDEKIKGTIHIAIGKNKMYGGSSNSSLHWDFISKDKINLEAIYPKGKIKTLIEKGKILSNA